MSKKVALILSGCGGIDGAEIQESVSSLLAIEKNGMTYQGFSLDENQKNVISPVTNKKLDQKRNMLEESARITHGNISNIDDLDSNMYDVLWIPGGFGVVTSFSDLEEKGASGNVHPKIEKLIKLFYRKRKPIVGVCIAPSIIAKTLHEANLTITLGKSDVYVKILEELGHNPKKIGSEDFIYDKDANIYSTPAYMDNSATCLKIFTACDKIAACIQKF